jgi:phosphohistidine phosphatase SixA
MRPTRSFLIFAITAAAAVTVLGAGQRGVTTMPAGPIEVMIIRHGEEPKDGPHLNDEGRARAKALITMFSNPMARPTSLFAAKSSQQSERSVETLTPLSKALGLRIDTRFDDSEYKKLANTVLHSARHAGGHVLICWHRETMTELAAALGVQNPPQWPSSQYDHLWRIKYAKGKKVTLTDELQNLPLGGKEQ